MDTYKYLQHTTDEYGICTLTLNNPQVLNALDTSTLDEITHCITNIKQSNTIRVLIITGVGKAFVAGANISEMLLLSEHEAKQFSEKGAHLFRTIETMDIPVVAAINGYALGGGCELALACDIRIAAESAIFGQPETKLGIIPGFSGTQRLAKLVGPGIAKELIFTGKTITAAEALRIGLVNHVVPTDELTNEVYKLASQIATNAPKAIAASKQCINQAYDSFTEQGIQFESHLFGSIFLTKDQKEGMTAFIEKRKPLFKNH